VADIEKDAIAMYHMLEDTDARTSPLRHALAVWGLIGDDIIILFIHSTSTRAWISSILYGLFINVFLQEKNETQIWNEIFASLARNPGNAMPVMAQQSLLGYWKGGSTAWVYCEPSALVLFT
jgi:fatty acid synthase subunit alpha, fungi type